MTRSRLVLALAPVLMAGSALAQSGMGVPTPVLDLTTTPSDEVLVLSGTSLALKKLAPAASYALTIRWTTGLWYDAPEEHQDYRAGELSPVVTAVLQRPQPAGCDAVAQRAREVLATTEETNLGPRLDALGAAIKASGCRDPGQLHAMLTQGGYAAGSRSVSAGSAAEYVVARVDANRTVERRWRVVVVNPVAAAASPEAREDLWIAGTIASDIADMATFAASSRTGQASLGKPVVSIASDSESGMTVARVAGVVPSEVFVQTLDSIWSPEAWAAYARAVLAQLGLRGTPAERPALYARLLEPRTQKLDAENRVLSAAFTKEMLNPALHEQAAMLLAAFAMRESAGAFSDTRPTLSRMAAHLAMARALRAGRPESEDGRFARVALMVLSGRTRDAVAELDRWSQQTPLQSLRRPWDRALRMRATGDWRILTKGDGATLLERFELQRTLKGSAPGRAIDFVPAEADADLPDWGRIALEVSLSVQVGNIYAREQLPLELTEAALVAIGWGVAPKDGDALMSFLNRRPGGLVSQDPAGPRPWVLDAGAWGAFAQRHILAAGAALRTYTWRIDDENRDKKKAALSKALARLDSLPLLMAEWIDKGQNVSAAEDCVRAAVVIKGRPESVPRQAWFYARKDCNGGPIPSSKGWFLGGPPPGTAYDADAHAILPSPTRNVDAARMRRLLAINPYSPRIIQAYVDLSTSAGERVDYAIAAAPILDYSIVARWAYAKLAVNTPAEYRKRMEYLAALHPDAFLDLGDSLAGQGLTEDAADAYQRGFDKATDRVSAARVSPWLVGYYLDRGDVPKATRVAAVGADVYSGDGLRAQAQLLERLGKPAEAETWYKKIQERYRQDDDLHRFYMRQAVAEPTGPYAALGNAEIDKAFPNGLAKIEATALPRPPTDQESFTLWAEPFKAIGLRDSDRIMTLDGYRVRTPTEFMYAEMFSDAQKMTLVVWRGDRYVTLSGARKRQRWRSIGTAQAR